jgi:glycerate dehydrogenase
MIQLPLGSAGNNRQNTNYRNTQNKTILNVKMNIVILDGYTTNPGDLSWDRLKNLGNLTVYDRTAPDEIIPRAIDCEIVLTNKTILSHKVIAALPNARYIGLLSTGTNAVDISAATERAIPVTNVPAYSTNSVAQAVFALLLELTNHVAQHNDSCRSGKWAAHHDFCFTETPLIELCGKTMGIVGFGAIGKAVAKIADAFEMQTLIHTRTPQATKNINHVSLKELFRKSDIISLHCPLTTKTEQIINSNSLSEMKNEALLINTGRGGLVDEKALANALNNNTIAGAGLDVLTAEPPMADNPLLTAKNCIITPHIAWATYAARKRLIETVVNNLSAFISGNPINVIL